MKKERLWWILLFCWSIGFAQNLSFQGYVMDKLTNKPIKGAQIKIFDNEIMTDSTGFFSFELTPGVYPVQIYAEGFQSLSFFLTIKEDVVLQYQMDRKVQDETDDQVPSLLEMDLENDKYIQPVAGILSASKDVFLQFSSFAWTNLKYKYRGYDQGLSEVYINGVPMHDYESGMVGYTEFSGLNRVVRFNEFSEGIIPAAYSLGNIGGLVNYFSTAAQIPKQIHLSLARSNRTYNNRIMFTYSSGLTNSGWAYALSFSKRWAEEGYIPGTWMDAYAYFLSVEKKITSSHQLAFTFFGSPYRRGLQAPATDEAFNLADDIFYNPNWGFQEGKIRNARVRNIHIPYLMLNHTWKVNEKNKIYSVLSFNAGRFGTTRLNWYNAPDPRPDYYRYLPSYQTDTTIANMVENVWRNELERRQINWNQLYQINYLSNIAEDGRAHYILEEVRKDEQRFVLRSYLHSIFSEHALFNAGIEGILQRTHYFKVVDDLLGAQYWLDIDQFAERDFPGNTLLLQNDLNYPNRKVKENDIFGYNYYLHTNTLNAYGLNRFYFPKVDLYAGAQVGFTQAYRYGLMKNGRFPDNSQGKSEVKYFPMGAIKGGVTYKITGRHYLQFNAGGLYLPPKTNQVFITPNLSNEWVSVLKNVKIFSGDATYFYKGLKWNARFGTYQTFILDQTDLISFYHDQLQTYVNVVMWGIDKVFQGLESGVEINIIPGFALQAAANVGNYRFISRPTAHINVENQSKPDTFGLVFIKYFYVPNIPQIIASGGIKYTSPSNWIVTITAHYATNMYMDFNPERRMQSALDGLTPSQQELIDAITQQVKMNDLYYLDFSAGKNWRIKGRQVGFNLMINNLLNKKFKTSGFEQYRFDFENKNISKFPPKYYYGWGRNYFIQFTFSL
ncbi:MAG: TonB-dependent receptor [Bacteroidales bacterium]|nr:TonB-dependent receptor [Bacteroidales bacterium]